MIFIQDIAWPTSTIVSALRKYGDILTRTNQTPPLDNYGLFWGCVAMSAPANLLLTAHAIYVIIWFITGHIVVMGVVVILPLATVVVVPIFAAVLLCYNLERTQSALTRSGPAQHYVAIRLCDGFTEMKIPSLLLAPAVLYL